MFEVTVGVHLAIVRCLVVDVEVCTYFRGLGRHNCNPRSWPCTIMLDYIGIA